jgi:hypothetical protein
VLGDPFRRRPVGRVGAGLIVADGDRRTAAIGGGDEAVGLETALIKRLTDS